MLLHGPASEGSWEIHSPDHLRLLTSQPLWPSPLLSDNASARLFVEKGPLPRAAAPAGSQWRTVPQQQPPTPILCSVLSLHGHCSCFSPRFMSSGTWTCPQVRLGRLLYRCMRVCHHLHPSAEGLAARQVGWLGSVFQQKRGVELLVEVRCLHLSILLTIQEQLQVLKSTISSGSSATGTYLDVEEVSLA